MKLITWDWKAYAPIEDIAEAAHTVSGGLVHIRYVDTESDQYAVIVSREPVTDEEANAFWAKRQEEYE